MKKTLLSIALLGATLTMAQVGINTEEPKATLDVVASPSNMSIPDGVIAPRMTGDEIKAKDLLYDTPQTGAIVYATAAVGGTPAGKTINIIEEGYYYFDGLVWTKFGSGTGVSGAEPWFEQGTTNEATANTQDIFQEGKVAIGFTDADGVSTKQLEVKGDFKSEYSNGSATSIIDNNYQGLGVSAMISENSGNLASFNTYASTINATSILTAQSSDKTSRIESNSSSGISLNHFTTSGSQLGSNVTIKDDEGVRFRFTNSGVNEGQYIFPRINGTANQVLTTAGGTLSQLSWQNVSDLAPEPWRIQGTTNAATANTQNIYQTGNVSIGSSTPIAPFISNGSTITPKLSVSGDVASTGAFYTNASKYADYVFEDYFDGTSTINEDYKFKSLEETAAYIKENKHLPGVTSIKDILKTENGYNVNLSELSIQQLEKIEELYLHTIEQQQEIEQQKKEIKDLKSRFAVLEALLLEEKNN